jgi:hypothetical protein
MDDSSYLVTLRDRSIETVAGADAFSHERVMTTFYRTGNARGAVDCWSAALASFRTDEILMIRRVEAEEAVAAEFSGLAAVS